MKKITILLVAFVGLIVTSCSSDDSGEATASIVGKWEYTQAGEVINGTEVLEAYQHQEGCNKDYIEFKPDQTFDDIWFSMGDSGCTSYNDPGTWIQNGNTIISSYNGDNPEEGEIITLNENTLKVKFINTSEGTTETYITVLTRR